MYLIFLEFEEPVLQEDLTLEDLELHSAGVTDIYSVDSEAVFRFVDGEWEQVAVKPTFH